MVARFVIVRMANEVTPKEVKKSNINRAYDKPPRQASPATPPHRRGIMFARRASPATAPQDGNCGCPLSPTHKIDT